MQRPLKRPCLCFRLYYHLGMEKKPNSNMGADSQLVACSLERDLVARIDELAARDRVTRSTWMREAIIAAYHKAARTTRTPLHGYQATGHGPRATGHGPREKSEKIAKSKASKLAA